MPHDNCVKSIAKAIQLLEQFDLGCPELGVTELATRLELPVSSVYRLLVTLQSLGYIRKNAVTGKYCLGLKVFILGNMLKFPGDLKRIAYPYIRELLEKYHETVYLGIIFEDTAIVLEEYELAANFYRTIPSLFRSRVPYCTALGKCLMAFGAADRREKVLAGITLKPSTPYTITDKTKLRAEWEKVAADGCAVDNQELELGLIAVGAPIFDCTGTCLAAMHLTFPSKRFNCDLEAIKQDIRYTASKITQQLRYHGVRLQL